MTAKVRSTHAALVDNYADARGRAESMLTSMKDITERIAALNTEIKSLQVTGGAAGSLQDQRDMLIDDLSKITEITTSNQPNGTVDIFAGNLVLIDSAGARDFPTTINYSTLSLTDGTTNFPVKGGALLGQIQSVNRISLAMQDLDNMANTMRTQINTLHQSGVNSAGVGGVRFFNDVPEVVPPTLPLPQTGAVDFDLDPAILADAQAIATGTTTAAGDGALALQISNSRTQKLSALGNRSITEFYRGHIDAIGREVAYQEAQLETYDAIVQQTSNQIQEQSGVSLDEEMADMMKFQRSYQAAARILTIMDQNAEDIINLIRR
jgi:flagellar hook-associated protein 1 FlgK